MESGGLCCSSAIMLHLIALLLKSSTLFDHNGNTNLYRRVYERLGDQFVFSV